MQNPVDPADFMLFDMEIAFSNYRVRLDRQRCNAGIIAKNLSGHRSTKPPYAYMNDNELARAVIMDSRANFVRKAFELYATGNYSIPEVANELFELGFMYELQPDKKIPPSTLDSMLRNLFYQSFERWLLWKRFCHYRLLDSGSRSNLLQGFRILSDRLLIVA